MATIADIAKLCNTSSATVSYVLNGHAEKHKISEQTQKNIIEAAKQLGYKSKKSKTLNQTSSAIAICWPYKYFETTMTAVIAGISQALSDEVRPPDIILKPFENGKLSEHEPLWKTGQVGAIIVIAADFADIEYLGENPPSVPVILVNRKLEGFSDVSIDNYRAAIMAADHAVNKSSGDLALVLNPVKLMGIGNRAEYITDFMKENNVDMSDKVFYCNNSIESGYQLGLAIIKNNRLPKVFLCMYDMVGLGIIAALNEANIKVGDEVQVMAISSGIQDFLARSSPPLTTVDIKMYELVIRSIRMAIGFIEKTLVGEQHVTIQPEIIYRASCPLNNF